ncbi:MAG: sensor histidine kinase [Clostridia bacterium]|nr:sensor histidine kinase [Clostridia bacterium]
MEVFDLLFTRLNFAITLLIAETVICSRFPKSKYFLLYQVIGWIPALVICFYWDDFVHLLALKSPMLSIFVTGSKFLIVFAITFYMMMLSYKGDFWAYLFAGVMAYCIQHIAYQTYGMIEKLWLGGASTLILLPVMAVIFAVYYVVLYFLFTRKLPRDTLFVVNNKWQVVLSGILLLITVYLSLYGVVFALHLESQPLYCIICLFSIFSCFFAILLEVSFLQIKRSEIEFSIMKHMVHAAKYQLEESKESIDIINIKSHDLRHQIAALQGRIDREELESITSAVDFYDSSFKTGNDALDVVLTEKGLLCKKKEVRLTCMVDGKKLSGMRPSDIYSLFGNAIENAVESVEKLESERRAVSIRELSGENFTIIRMENFFDGEIDFLNGLPQTKKDTRYHGFGVKSMRMIAEKYGGSLNASVTGDIFRIDLFLPAQSVPQKAAS